MSEEKHEALSALIDGELSEEDGPRLLDNVLEDVSLKRRWATYHLIGDVMRKHVIDRESPGEQTDRGGRAAPTRSDLAPPRTRGMNPLAGLALAASVAAAAVLGLFAVSESDKPPEVMAQSTASIEVPAPSVSEPASIVAGAVGIDLARMTWNDAEPAVTNRLNGYLVTHNEHIASGMRGMLPYARIVAYDGRQN